MIKEPRASASGHASHALLRGPPVFSVVNPPRNAIQRHIIQRRVQRTITPHMRTAIRTGNTPTPALPQSIRTGLYGVEGLAQP